MHYIVCIKQVPEGTEVEIDEKGVLKREGVESKINVYDLHALEAAVRLKEELGGKVTVVSMGPPQAEAVIREAFSLGADEGYLLSDRAFAGADTLATSYTLAEAIRRLSNHPIVFCGMQTTDGDTAQVGPGIAEFLSLPHVSYVTHIHSKTNEAITVDTDLGDGIETVRIKLPCLLTVTSDVNEPRLPSYRLMKATADRPVTIWSSADLDGADIDLFGLSGSPTQVERIFAPPKRGDRELFDDEAHVLADVGAAKLREMKFI